MAFGQYSAGGGVRRTKVDIVETIERQGYEIETSRKAGHNRLDATLTDGRRVFVLHETVVATLSADRTVLTLADGGWHTLTTKAAWGDACAAFGIADLWTSGQPRRDEREVRYAVGPNPADIIGPPREPSWWTSPARIPRPLAVVGRLAALDDVPMIRASVDDGNFAVRFTGDEIVSEAGARFRATPFKVLVTLLRHDALIRHVKRTGRFAWFDAFGLLIAPGNTNARWSTMTRKVTSIGCHDFLTADIRSAMKRIAAEHPQAYAKARAFVRKHKPTFQEVAR